MEQTINDLTNLDEKFIKALIFANKSYKDLKIDKYYMYYYNLLDNDESNITIPLDIGESYCSVARGDDKLYLGCYHREVDTNNVDFGIHITFCTKHKKVLCVRSNPSVIYFMDGEIRLGKKWYSYKEIEECAFQISTIHNGLDFILTVANENV